ncbi:MAG: ATP-binding protein [Bacilli bacterium]
MSRKRTIIESAVAASLILIIYTVFAIVVFITTSGRTTSTLTNASSIAQAVFNGNKPEETGENIKSYFATDSKDSIRVSIIIRDSSSSGYSIKYDSMDMYEANNTPLELDNLDKTITRQSTYGYNMIYLAVKDNENPTYFIRVSMAESSATSISRGFMINGTIIMVILIGVYLGYKVYSYQKTIKPLKTQIDRLILLSGDEASSLTSQDDIIALSNAVERVSGVLTNQIKSLTTEREKTKTILNSISQGFLSISGEGKIVLFNKAASEIFGFSEEEALNNNYHILLTSNVFNEKIAQALKYRQEIKPFDLGFNGRIYQIAIMNLDYSWKDFTQTGIAILLLDVTGERNVYQIKTDFFQNASHELKSPLTSILGYQEMISSGIITDEKEIQEAVIKTVTEAKRMKEILSDMLVLNKLENGEKKHLETINLKDEITSIVSNLKPQAARNNISIVTELSDLNIHSDKEDIKSLFTNLIDNAIKYNRPDGNIRIVSEGKNIIVSDNGIGIKTENQNRVFERFYRVDNSRHESNIEGSGLGLAIVKHICETYGYRITLKSTYGQGTSFTISFD